MAPTSAKIFGLVILLLFSTRAHTAINPILLPLPTKLTGPAAGSNFGSSVSTAGDINGDGYSDVLVGAPYYSANTGAVFVYMGTSNGLATTPAITLLGPAPNSQFGTEVRTAGDVNGDGFSDVIIGTEVSGQVGSPSIGSAYVYLGSASGLSASPANSLAGTAANYFGTATVSGVGDVNGDGYSDVIVGRKQIVSDPKVFLYLGSGSGLANTPSKTLSVTLINHSFGGAVSGAGDVNGDGYSDVLIGSVHNPDRTGSVYLFTGSALGLNDLPENILIGTANGFFGSSLASAGDMNGDGLSDVLIGDYMDKGKVHIYLGQGSGLNETAEMTLEGYFSGENLGFSVSSAGDTDGDGYSDILIGAPGEDADSKSHVYLYKGLLGGVQSVEDLVSPEVGSAFGTSVLYAGDVNGDGFSDVITGAFQSASATGAAYVYNGRGGGISDNDQGYMKANFADHGFGQSVAGAGDINGDGYADVIVGSHPFNSFGQAQVYLGSREGVQSLADFIMTGPDEGSEFGKEVAGVGDVNGDGFSDIIVGAPGVGAGVGAAYLYLGSATGLSATPASVLQNPSAKRFGFSAASAGDVNGDGYGDIIIGAPDLASGTGFASIYLGKPFGVDADNPILISKNEFRYFGHSVATAGDVNGDGFSDIIVGAPTFSSSSGAALLYYGNAAASFSEPAIILNANEFTSFYGFSVAGIGDVNGDGFSDVSVTDPAYSPAKDGRIYTYFGSPTGIEASEHQVMESPAAGGLFGWAASGAGDVNGDGYSDLVVGALAASESRGTVYMYFGSENGFSNTPDQFWTGFAARDFYGKSVAAAGDVDGDGFSDIIRGDSNFGINGDGHGVVITETSAIRSSGNANVMFANRRGNQHRFLRIYNADLSSRISISNRSSNEFGIGLFVRSYSGPVEGRLVWETQPNGVSFEHNSPISNYTGFSGSQTAWTDIPIVGLEMKTLIEKAEGRNTKFRVRLQYKSTDLPFGQTFGAWVYPQNYLNGVLGQSGAPLPVSLVSFLAKKEGSTAVLSWITSSETKSERFEIEHSTSGKTWYHIGTIAATGESQVKTDYMFVHANPSPGRNFYRLKMIDQDQTFSHSRMQSLFMLAESGLTIFPNPVGDRLKITLSNVQDWEQINDVHITNARGQHIYASAKITNKEINVSGFSAGEYIVSVKLGSGLTYHTKFVIVR